MISKETAQKIWSAYNEIEKAEILKQDIEKELLNDLSKASENYRLTNIFGESHRCQFGVPSGKDSYRLFYVNSSLALSIIEQHIFDMKKKLAELEKELIGGIKK